VPLGSLNGYFILRLFPGEVTAFEDFGCDLAVTKPGRRAFAEGLALLTDDDDRLAGEASRPLTMRGGEYSFTNTGAPYFEQNAIAIKVSAPHL
jgi:hypothetical protein